MALPGLSEDEKGGGVVPKVTGRKNVELGGARQGGDDRQATRHVIA